jgi:hypothetical protein
MAVRYSWTNAHNYYKRTVARRLFKRPLAIRTPYPLISFTFDDFPRSALLTGGEILRRHGLAGTYYVCLGSLGEDSPSGRLCVRDDLTDLLEQGHELGCHTFTHCHSWDTEPKKFGNAIRQNRAALDRLIPGAEFESLSYPMAEPRPTTKLEASKHFLCCRSGGQTLNVGTADLNQLSAYFLEKRPDGIQQIRDLINLNRDRRGWTIFATHDIAENPSLYGCTPTFFEEVVEFALHSGAVILPVARALEVIRSS